MNQLKNFSHDMFGNFEILIKEGKEYFPATEVATVLGYANPRDAITRHCKKDGIAAMSKNTTEGNSYDKKFINESNLYRLIVKSKLPQAEQFEKWVFEDVLPSIRKHQGYLTPAAIEETLTNPDFIIGLATKLKEEQQARQLAERTIIQQKPLVTFAEACMQSDKSLKVSEVAKMATKHNIKIGQRQLFEKIREWGLMFKRSTEPTQKAVEQGLFEITQGVKQKPSGEPFTWTTTYVTQKGQAYIIDRLKKEENKEVS